MTTVLIVDDDALVRQYLRGILTDQGFEVVAEVNDGGKVLAAVVRHRPELILMDLDMKPVDGVEAIKRVRALSEPPRCVAVTTLEDAVKIKEALAAGALGYIVKSDPPEAWGNLLRDVLDGGGAMSKTASRRIADDFAAAGPDAAVEARARIEKLTGAERDVVAYVEGRTNVQIGACLFISEHTVKSHLKGAMTKLGYQRRSQLAALAREAGISVPPEP
ncbi:response regulator transcription factor [Myceligenerans crystallogenes]|uniref:Response regulator transcription factor n=1 Tax=Myceligenerans crystallogenes TaxID=316335 RepID=A0ABP5A077_9MICO